MSKEVQKIICAFCESEFKLSYNLDDTSGHPKFCTFCGSDLFDEPDEDRDEDSDD